MDNAIQVFHHQILGDVQVLPGAIDSGVWFVGSDIARILGVETGDMVRQLRACEKRKLVIRNGAEPRYIVNAPGVYRAAFSSQKEAALVLQDWVYSILLYAKRYGAPGGKNRELSQISQLEARLSACELELQEHKHRASVILQEQCRVRQELMRHDVNSLQAASLSSWPAAGGDDALSVLSSVLEDEALEDEALEADARGEGHQDVLSDDDGLGESFYTIRGFAKARRIRVPKGMVYLLGRRAAKESRKRREPMQLLGGRKGYRPEVLEDLFRTHGLLPDD